MRKFALCTIFCLCLLGVTCGHAAAVQVTIDGAALDAQTVVDFGSGTTYVSYWPVVKALYPSAAADWEDGQAVVRTFGLELRLQPGASYLEANGRCLWIADGIRTGDQDLLVPIRVLGKALGASVTWDAGNSTACVFAGSGPICSGSEFYSSDSIYWLSHIINAESGNQPLAGKIAVGNVVLNRVASPQFPNSIYEVIFQRGQFTPAQSGSIYLTPNAESVIAAKLCLEGVNTAGNSLFFVNPATAPNSWAMRNCTYVDTIGAHAFFS